MVVVIKVKMKKISENDTILVKFGKMGKKWN